MSQQSFHSIVTSLCGNLPVPTTKCSVLYAAEILQSFINS